MSDVLRHTARLSGCQAVRLIFQIGEKKHQLLLHKAGQRLLLAFVLTLDLVLFFCGCFYIWI